ncbi:EamA family transporter, partial [Salmonella enterica subsp. enterica serovar Typhimurium]
YSSQLLGGAVVIFGLFLFTLSTKRKKKQVTISWKA